MKISENASTILSIILTAMVMLAIVATAFLIPVVFPWYFDVTSRDTAYLHVIYAWLYASLVPAIICDIALLKLLFNVRKQEIFTPESVSALRIISWCCFGEAVIFGFLSVYFISATIVAFAAVFLGIVLRVVKNVIEEATRIKAENDCTI